MSTQSLRRELSFVDATSIVVGTIMGSAIFLVPAAIADHIESPKIVFLIWALGGALSLSGALSLAELGAMYPDAGGLYVYLREVYGSLPAFLYGWTLLSMIQSGSIAALAVGFSLYTSQLFSLGAVGQKLVAAVCILSLTVVNILGIQQGKFVQNIFTCLKLGGVSLMIVTLLSFEAKSGLLRAALRNPVTAPSWSGIGAAIIGVLWAYEGWHVVSFAAAEMKQPRTDLPRSLAAGTAVILTIYLLANLAYYAVLTPTELHSNPAVAATAVAKSFGPTASRLLSVLILISIVGAANGLILTGPRVYYAMAQDGLFFRAFGRTNQKYRTPASALLAQGVWASLLSCSGTYQQLFTDVIFSAWIFYGLTVAGVIVLRRSKPLMDRPFRLPGSPWVPLFFCTAAWSIVVSAVASAPRRSLLGIGLILTGVPLFMFFRLQSARDGKKPNAA